MQRDSMRDRDIENWEDQAKIGLLHNNDLLQAASTTLRATLFQPVELSTGNTIFLHEIGISTTSNFRDGGRLEIDEERLRGALETRGLEVAELFTKTASIPFRAGFTNNERMAQQGISERINDILNNTVGTSGTVTLRAGIRGDSLLEMTSTMFRTIREQNDRMEEMRRQLERRETNLFQMFSRMEQAVTASNNQMAYIQAQLGF
jgi:flagellar hook-associated protein 2